MLKLENTCKSVNGVGVGDARTMYCTGSGLEELEAGAMESASPEHSVARASR